MIDCLPPSRRHRPVDIPAEGERERYPGSEIKALTIVATVPKKMATLDGHPSFKSVIPETAMALKIDLRQNLKDIILIVSQILIIARLGTKLSVLPGLQTAGSGSGKPP